MGAKDNKIILFKTLLVLLLLVQFTGCEVSSSPEEQTKYFSPEKLLELHLDSVGGFWENDSIRRISDYVTAQFDRHPDHLASISYSGVTANRLTVSVFETQESVINAMEEFINTTTAIIFPGESHGDYGMERDEYFPVDIQQRIRDKWWWDYSGGMGLIIINKWNTIITASNNSDSIGARIAEAAIEIAERVDALSEVVE